MRIALILLTGLVVWAFSTSKQKQGFTFTKNDEGVLLTENGRPVFFYQKENRSSDGKHYFSNYIHPLFSLEGDTLTEEFPADHKHHRGIFWAWHQHYIDDKSLGDGWIMQDITYNVERVATEVVNGNAVMKTRVLWTSEKWQDGKPYIEENTTITVHPSGKDKRIIDFKITLKALTKDISIGGSNDQKGYGGFSMRIKMPDGLTFTSEKGKITPQLNQVEAGPWMDFSAPFGKYGDVSGITLICDKSDPHYPQPWILRQKNSMQNIVFPGREKFHIPEEKPVILKYRLIIHKGDSKKVEKLIN